MSLIFITIGAFLLFIIEQGSQPNKTYNNKFLPLVFFIGSLLIVFKTAGHVRIYGEMIELVDRELIILRSLGMLLFLNLPTVALLTMNTKNK